MAFREIADKWFAGTLPRVWEAAHGFLVSSLRNLERILLVYLRAVDTLRADTDTLQSDVDTLQADLDALEADAVLLSGRAGGQIIPGGNAAGEDQTLTSNTTATKDRIFFGAAQTSAYDEVNTRLGVGVPAPGATIHAQVNSGSESVLQILENQGAGGVQARLMRGTQTWAQRIDGSDNYTIRDVTAAKSPLSIAKTAPTDAVRVDGSGNLGINTATFGTSAAGVIGHKSGTAPTTSPTDTVQVWPADSAAADANWYARNEAGQTDRLTGNNSRLAAQFDKTNTTLADVTGLTRNVEAGKSYYFEGCGTFDASAAGGIKFAVAGTCTATSIEYHVRVIADATGTWTSSRHTALASATGFAVGPTAGWTTVSGVITVANAGTLLLQFAQQVASGTSSLRRGWAFWIKEIT